MLSSHQPCAALSQILLSVFPALRCAFSPVDFRICANFAVVQRERGDPRPLKSRRLAVDIALGEEILEASLFRVDELASEDDFVLGKGRDAATSSSDEDLLLGSCVDAAADDLSSRSRAEHESLPRNSGELENGLEPTAGVGVRVAAEMAAHTADPKKWVPGRNLPALLFPSGVPTVGPVATVMLNALVNLRDIPRKLLRQCLDYLPSRARDAGESAYIAFAATVTRFSSKMLYNFLKFVRIEGSEAFRESAVNSATCTADAASESSKPTQSDKQAEQKNVLARLVRASLDCHSRAEPSASFKHTVARWQSEGIYMGQSGHTQELFFQVRFLTARCLELQTARTSRTAAPALGIPSTFSLVFDGVPIGGMGAFSRHGNPLVVGKIAASPASGRLEYQNLAPAFPQSHTGIDTKVASLPAASRLASQPTLDEKWSWRLRVCSFAPRGISLALLLVASA